MTVFLASDSGATTSTKVLTVRPRRSRTSGSTLARNVLFICSQNRLRSPTAEHIFSDWPGIEVQSAGLNQGAEVPVSPEILDWAELIFVMEKAHRNKLAKKFQRHLGGKRVICIDIPDEYEYMDPVLIQLLMQKVTRFLPGA